MLKDNYRKKNLWKDNINTSKHFLDPYSHKIDWGPRVKALSKTF